MRVQVRECVCICVCQLLEPSKGGGGDGKGFNVPRTGNARVALIGFPSVGKSSLLSAVTGAWPPIATPR